MQSLPKRLIYSCQSSRVGVVPEVFGNNEKMRYTLYLPVSRPTDSSFGTVVEYGMCTVNKSLPAHRTAP
jgi:hypothetical protein